MIQQIAVFIMALGMVFTAIAAVAGRASDIDPTQWAIVDGKLYLNKNESVQKRWNADRPGFIQKADQRWPGVIK